jgi:hypothetical protein
MAAGAPSGPAGRSNLSFLKPRLCLAHLPQ